MHVSIAHVLQQSNESAIPAEVVSRRPVCAGKGLTSFAQVNFPRVCFLTTASERHFVFPVGHGVFVPFCPCWTLCLSLEPNAGAACLVEVLDRTTACKTGVYFFPKMLREKVETLHLPVLGSALIALTQELVLPPEFCGQFCVILHVNRLQILCQLQFCLSSTS